MARKSASKAKFASKAKSKTSSAVKKARKKLPKSKGRFYEDPQLVRSRRDPNYKTGG